MNQNKAREFFSAYNDGALDGGLRQSFETKLRTDAAIQADYSAFLETVRDLDSLRDEVIEVPSYLSDRIATRLEQARNEKKSTVFGWATWMKGLAVAGLATIAIVGALPFLQGKSDISQGGIAGTSSNLDQIGFKIDGSKIVLLYQPSSAKTLVVSSPTNGREIRRFNLDSQRVESPIENTLRSAAVFKIEVLGDKSSSLITIPGQETIKAKAGDGSIQDLALAISGHYHVPVVIQSADVTHHVTWNMSSSDARAAASQALVSEGFSVDQRQDGMIEIQDH